MDENLTPTDEQQEVIDLFGSGESLGVSALAGTGKTASLAMAAAAYPQKRIRYVAFSKALSVDAKDAMPPNVEVSTIHSLAIKVSGGPYRHRLGGKRKPSWETARNLGIRSIPVQTEDGQVMLNPDYLAGVVMMGLRRYCSSADPEPLAKHMPFIEGVDLPDAAGRRTYVHNDEIRDELLPFLRAAWADQCDPRGDRTRYEHFSYLKLYALEERQIEADAAFIDEAQDLQEVMAQIFRQQRSTQLVAVGDEHQMVFEFLRTVNGMVEIQPTNHAYLTASWRFGPAIAEAANEILTLLGSERLLVGKGPQDGTVGPIKGPPRSVLSRTNATAVRELLQHQAAGHKVHLVGGGQDIASFARGAGDLMEGRSTNHRELAPFSSWSQVQSYVNADPEGDDLRLLVRLVDEFTVPIILEALDGGVPMNRADVCVLTAHKGKGLTFDSTMIAGDFPDETTEGAELRLLYVACTRPRHTLDVTRCGAMGLILGDQADPGASSTALSPPPAESPSPAPTTLVSSEGELDLFGEPATS